MTHEPGIYFGLDEEAYHADPALSSSGIRNLLISPLDYWTNSRLNPDYVDEKTPAMIAGTAFHRRLLEPERFASMYAGMPSKADYPDAIDGGEALAAECARLGLKKSGTIAERCERILDADPRARLWPVIQQGLLAGLEGKTLLKADVLADIERTAAIISAHQSAAKALTGGHAEVSVFWIDPNTGVRMKARIDYLKIKATVDIKTFSNPMGKPIDAAVASAVANNRYDVQAVVYDAAVKAAKEMLRTKKLDALHGAEAVDHEWLLNFAACKDHAFVFVFIEQGPVTNVRVREFRRTETHGGNGASANLYWQAGEAGVAEALRRYAECMRTFGPNQPWIEDRPMTPFADTEFPIYLFN